MPLPHTYIKGIVNLSLALYVYMYIHIKQLHDSIMMIIR